MPATVSLTAGAALLWCALGLGVGIGSARRKRGAGLLSVVSIVGVSTPPFWLALLLLWAFADRMGLFPLGGYQSLAEGGLGGWARSLCLPWLTLALLYAGWYARLARTGLEEDATRVGKELLQSLVELNRLAQVPGVIGWVGRLLRRDPLAGHVGDVG